MQVNWVDPDDGSDKRSKLVIDQRIMHIYLFWFIFICLTFERQTSLTLSICVGTASDTEFTLTNHSSHLGAWNIFVEKCYSEIEGPSIEHYCDFDDIVLTETDRLPAYTIEVVDPCADLWNQAAGLSTSNTDLANEDVRLPYQEAPMLTPDELNSLCSGIGIKNLEGVSVSQTVGGVDLNTVKPESSA